MAHQLDFIKHAHIKKAIHKIDVEGVPNDHQWSEYWINYSGKLYQFKYVVEVASSFTDTPIETGNFRSNDSSRKLIASLGFHILYKSTTGKQKSINYWGSASYYGLMGNQTDKITDFLRDNFWRTDHDLTSGEGLRIWNELQKTQINDRICVRYLDKKGNKMSVAAVGTIYSVEDIEDGKLGVMWDFNPPQYSGRKPSGEGAGNWWKTLIPVTREADISKIFGEKLVQKRVARIAWNYFGWVMPSGKYGKSKDPKSHEARFGYGHEEWLFDTSKLVNGYHYGFLEPIRKQQDAFSGKIYNVWLYSINGETKKRFWVGEIKNLIVLEKQEAVKAREIYVTRGWFKEMQEQIKATGADKGTLAQWKGLDLLNVKFKPEDLVFNDPPFELSDTHPIVGQSRYAFGHFKPNFEIGSDLAEDDFDFESSSQNIDDKDKPLTKTHTRQPKAIEIEYLHRAISDSLTITLQQTYGKSNVTREHRAGYRANKIDIVVRHPSHLAFFEIKTYNSLKTSIREAVGQLLEYCFYPNKHKAKELIIVTQLPADQPTKTYFQHLRKALNLPIYYQSYNLHEKRLSEKH